MVVSWLTLAGERQLGRSRSHGTKVSRESGLSPAQEGLLAAAALQGHEC